MVDRFEMKLDRLFMDTFSKIIIALYATTSMAFAQVGMREITAEGLPITLVYPTEDKVVRVQRGEFGIDVAMNAKPKLANRRLIVISHGTAGSTLSDHLLAITFARAGYIVAQPLHTADNYKDGSKAGPESFKTRPLEISKTINSLESDPLFGSLFVASKVGVHGMSAGGGTALTVAGGKWNMLTMIQHCGKNLDEDLGFCLSGVGKDKLAQIKRRAQYMSGAIAPEAFLPAELKTLYGGANDARIRAVTVSVPVAAIFTPESLSKIAIPVGVLAASNDDWLLPKFHSEYVLRECKSCVSLGTLPNAAHMDLLAPWPAAIAKSVGSEVTRGGMPNPKFDAKDREAGFARIVQFFNQHLN
jgi:predicted dienelactone hydrolase